MGKISRIIAKVLLILSILAAALVLSGDLWIIVKNHAPGPPFETSDATMIHALIRAPEDDPYEHKKGQMVPATFRKGERWMGERMTVKSYAFGQPGVDLVEKVAPGSMRYSGANWNWRMVKINGQDYIFLEEEEGGSQSSSFEITIYRVKKNSSMSSSM